MSADAAEVVRVIRDRQTVPADLQERRMRREGWPPESAECERRAGARVGRLYPLIGLDGGVQTPQGQGTLIQAFSSGCQVVLTRGKKTGVRAKGERYRPMREFAVKDVKPYRKGAT